MRALVVHHICKPKAGRVGVLWVGRVAAGFVELLVLMAHVLLNVRLENIIRGVVVSVGWHRVGRAWGRPKPAVVPQQKSVEAEELVIQIINVFNKVLPKVDGRCDAIARSVERGPLAFDVAL